MSRQSVFVTPNFAFLCLLTICLCPIMAQDLSLSGKTILAKSFAEMEQLKSFSSSTMSEQSKITIRQKIFYKRNPDGTVSERIETSGESSKARGNKDRVASVFQVKTPAGVYQWFSGKKIAVKCDFLTSTSQLSTQLAAKKQISSDGSTYSVAERQLSTGEPIYSVKKTLGIAEFDNTVDVVKQSLESLNLPTDTVLDKVPYITVYLVRKSDYFLVGTETYNKTGSLIARFEQNDIAINIPLADSLFKIPSGFKTKIASTPQEMSKIFTGSK